MPDPIIPTIHCFVLGPFETNCYVVTVDGSEDCWIIDAGFSPQSLIDAVSESGKKPAALILTHAHVDHIAGIGDVLEAFGPIPILIHDAEREWLGSPQLNMSTMLGLPVTAPEPDRAIQEGQTLELGGSSWSVLHTPGHSPGGITLYNAAGGVALVGDSLFAGSIGRTDFPNSDFATLADSIRSKLYVLPDETRVYPGHGPDTTIGREKRSNPFVPA